MADTLRLILTIAHIHNELEDVRARLSRLGDEEEQLKARNQSLAADLAMYMEQIKEMGLKVNEEDIWHS